MIDNNTLLSDLQKLLTQLEDDIRNRCDSQPEVDRPLQEQYAAAKAAIPGTEGRIAGSLRRISGLR